MITACWFVGRHQRDYTVQSGVAPADCWNCGEWELKEYISSVRSNLTAQYQNIFPNRTVFQFLCPHRWASMAGRRARSPVSYHVSLIAINALGHRSSSNITTYFLHSYDLANASLWKLEKAQIPSAWREEWLREREEGEPLWLCYVTGGRGDDKGLNNIRRQKRRPVLFPINSLCAFGIIPLLYKPISFAGSHSKQILPLTIETSSSIWNFFSTVSF